MTAHPLSLEIVAAIDRLEAEDDFMQPPRRSLELDGSALGLLLSLAHEGAVARLEAGDENASQALQLVATAVMAAGNPDQETL
jgi:hypothetical protein